MKNYNDMPMIKALNEKMPCRPVPPAWWEYLRCLPQEAGYIPPEEEVSDEEASIINLDHVPTWNKRWYKKMRDIT